MNGHWVQIAGLAAAWAVWGWWPDPPLRRLRPSPAPRLGPPAWLAARPSAMSGRKRTMWALVAGVVALLVLPLPPGIGPWIAGPVGLGVWWGLGQLEPSSARSRADAVAEALPSTLDLLAGCLAAGLPIRAGATVVGASAAPAVRELLDQVLAGLDVGVPEADAWAALAGQPVFGPVARDIGRACAWGTGLSETLMEHASRLRAERTAALQVKARAVGVRAVLPLTVCYLPAFLLLGIVPVIASGLLAVIGT